MLQTVAQTTNNVDEKFKGVLRFAKENGLATVVGDTIQIMEKGSFLAEKQLQIKTQEFWVEIVKQLMAIDLHLVLYSCAYIKQKPGEPIPFTRMEQAKKLLRMHVEQKTIPGEVSEVEVVRPRLAINTLKLNAEGVVTLGLNNKEAERLRRHGVTTRCCSEAPYPYRLQFDAGCIERVVLL